MFLLVQPLDVFVVKYTGDNNGRRHLGVHCDQSTQSFVIRYIYATVHCVKIILVPAMMGMSTNPQIAG